MSEKLAKHSQEDCTMLHSDVISLGGGDTHCALAQAIGGRWEGKVILCGSQRMGVKDWKVTLL